MSDFLDGGIDPASAEPEGLSSAYVRDRAPLRMAGEAPPVDWFRLAEWLPRLGSVLWLHRATADTAFPRARLAEEGVLLLDHPALAAFSSCAALQLLGAPGAPVCRERVEWIGTHGECTARMYLLPDTDHFAWDDMIADCAIGRAAPRASARTRLSRLFRRTAASERAYIVRFPLLRLPCLRVLGLRAPGELSALGRATAAAIARSEAVALRIPV